MAPELLTMMSLDIRNRMKPILLSEMKGICLMNRIDTKYMMPVSMLPQLLTRLEHDFRIQQVNGQTVGQYWTLYYDTKELEMYLNHHNCRLPREKIRMRTYLDSNLTFLEIKRKSNKGRTSKERIQLPLNTDRFMRLGPDVHDFLAMYSTYSEADLFPQINSMFNRITLVNNNKSERITIDTNLNFSNCQTGETASVPELMIIELKQDGKVSSKLKECLTEYRIFPGSISKYCLGTILTNPTVKSNQFKRKLRTIQKLTR